MICTKSCRHQPCPHKYECGYPLRQAEGGLSVDTEPAQFVAPADLPRTVAVEWLILAAIVVAVGVLVMIRLWGN